jgi:UDP-2,3-diacylglucosamine pyrophosphatase LpxH
MDVEVYPREKEVSLGGKRAFVAHGDLSNPANWSYLTFRKILKNRWTYKLIHFAGPRFCRRIARFLSERSYEKYHLRPRSHPPEAFRSFAHRKFLEGFEVVILGHSHFPEEIVECIDGKKCLYFNVGDWMARRSFLRFTPPGRFELSRFDPEERGDGGIG